jgi:transposase
VSRAGLPLPATLGLSTKASLAAIVPRILSTAGSFELVLANAQHVKAVPGRKRDVSDAVWLGDLQAHGLIRGSFVPLPEVAEVRSLMRTRKQLVRERTSHTQRIQKTLPEDARGGQH